MSIRETIAKKKSVSVAAAVLALGMAACVIGMQFRPERVPSGTKACYTDDDGATFFVDDAYKVVPFDHNGFEAVRAIVFTYAGGSKHFVMCLVRYSEEGQRKITEALSAASDKKEPASSIALFGDQSLQEVKLPGADHAWVKRTSSEAKDVMAIKSPDGSAVDMLIP